MLYLTLRHYEYVTAIAQEGSLSGAANVLNVSQPSLSNALDTIEARTRTQLFLRGRGKALTITPQGRQFVALAADLLARAQQLEHSGTSPIARATLGFGCFHDLAPFVLAPALALIGTTLPETTVRPHVGSFSDLIDAMTQGSVDIAITWDIGLDARFERTVLGHITPHVFVAPDHPLAAARSLSLAELAEHPLILSDEGLSQQHMIRLCAQAGFTPTIAMRTTSIEVMRSMAARGAGVGISYGVPPGPMTYDGMACLAIPLSDPAGIEPVVLTQLGAPVSGDSLDQVQKAFLAAGLFEQS